MGVHFHSVRNSGLTFAAIATLILLEAGPAWGQAPRLVRGEGVERAGYITAGAAGAEYVLPAGGSVKLGPGTNANVFAFPQSLGLRPGGTHLTYSVVLRRGGVEVELPTKTQPRTAVLVTAPMNTGVITLAGRSMTIATDEAVTTANLGGDSMVRQEGSWTPLEPGATRSSRSALTARSRPGVLVRAPTRIEGRGLYLATGAQASVGGISWQPVPGAVQYRVTLVPEVPGPSPSVACSEPRLTEPLLAAPGRYGLVVRGYDHRGLPGAASAPFPITIAGLELPAGAYASDDARIFLAEGQTVRFTHADDLSLSIRGASQTQPAGTPVGLLDGKRTVVALVRPRALQFALARLEPRTAYASVRATPKNAVWPFDPISIEIELKGEQGQSSIELQPSVQIGIEPVEVDWIRDGTALRGTVAPQTCPDFCVLRVEVRDQHGLLLGRDLVEILGSRKGAGRKPAAPAARQPAPASPPPAPPRPRSQPQKTEGQRPAPSGTVAQR